MKNISWERVHELVEKRIPRNVPCYGVPRGGTIVAALQGNPVEKPEDAAIIVDDIIDSGRTRAKWRKRFPKTPFVALIRKQGRDGWIHFPWDEEPQREIEDHIVRILEYIGEKPQREGLRATPERVVRSWRELFSGYGRKPEDVLLCDFGADGYDQMIVVRDIEFYSTCEHHMQPFFGRAHVGYLPDKRVVGLSKLARLVEIYSRRLQIQERLTQQIAKSLLVHLQPRGVGVVMEAKHFCMICRGVNKQDSEAVTSALEGCFRESPVRTEFFNLINGH